MPPLNAVLKYLDPAGEEALSRAHAPGEADERGTGKYDDHAVDIRDGRPLADSFSLDREGFVFLHHESAVTDFYDDDQIRDIYDPEMERLVKEQTGAEKVVIFDHTRRAGDRETQEALSVRSPVPRVHNDYTEFSGPQRVRDFLPPEEAEQRLRHRFAVIQIWRPIDRPVARDPLAICDASSMEMKDFIPVRRVYDDRVGEVYHVAHGPGHRWFWFPHMTRDEALLFTCYDSKTDGRARFTAHAAFTNPDAPEDAPPRRSMEIRLLAFFGPEHD